MAARFLSVQFACNLFDENEVSWHKSTISSLFALIRFRVVFSHHLSHGMLVGWKYANPFFYIADMGPEACSQYGSLVACFENNTVTRVNQSSQ